MQRLTSYVLEIPAVISQQVYYYFYFYISSKLDISNTINSRKMRSTTELQSLRQHLLTLSRFETTTRDSTSHILKSLDSRERFVSKLRSLISVKRKQLKFKARCSYVHSLLNVIYPGDSSKITKETCNRLILYVIYFHTHHLETLDKLFKPLPSLTQILTKYETS